MKKIILLSFSFLASIFFACDNSLNLITDWKETTIVYTFLDRYDSITYIKVNKAFLGNDNIYTMAKIRDSSEYQNISVTLEKYLNKKLVKTFIFEPTEVDHKNDGIFYNPNQTVYAAITYNGFDAIYTPDTSYTYKVKIINNSGDIVSATIPLVSERMNFQKPKKNIAFSDNMIHKAILEWDTVKNGYIYNFSAEFEFLEVFTNEDTISRTVYWDDIFTVVQSDYAPTVTKRVQGIEFFEMVLEEVPYQDNTKEESVVKRRVGNLTFVIKVGNRDYHRYLTLNSYNELNQELANFSNIENGYGLVSSRITHRYTIALSDGTTKNILQEDLKYDHLKFESFQ